MTQWMPAMEALGGAGGASGNYQVASVAVDGPSLTLTTAPASGTSSRRINRGRYTSNISDNAGSWHTRG
jgi:hypothetical protein